MRSELITCLIDLKCAVPILRKANLLVSQRQSERTFTSNEQTRKNMEFANNKKPQMNGDDAYKIETYERRRKARKKEKIVPIACCRNN